MKFTFRAERKPFCRWMGPFSPARGTTSGFRFVGRTLGAWKSNDRSQQFWRAQRTEGVRGLESLVLKEWDGGRVLLLPNGYAIKPLRDEEVGRRAFIGTWTGDLVLETPEGRIFNLASPPGAAVGEPWKGPDMIGLECNLNATDGSLSCTWYHPTDYGREEVGCKLRGPDPKLAKGSRICRPHGDWPRVRITANGHVITKRQLDDQSWITLYVGHVPHDSWGDWRRWIIGGGL